MKTHREGAGDARVKEAIDKVLDGDTDGAAKILSETIAGAAPDPDDIVAGVHHRLQMQDRVSSFNAAYKDVMADKYLATAVDHQFAELAPKDARGNLLPLSPDDFDRTLRKAGDSVRAWRDRMAGSGEGGSRFESDSPDARSAAIREIAAARGQGPR